MTKRIRSEGWRRDGNPGFRLRIKRITSRLNQYELALRAGLRQDRISRIECGWVQPTPRERQALAAALGCAEADLFPDEEKD